MNIYTTVIGLALAMVAWFNPFSLDMMVRIAVFILGFDMIWIGAKVAMFALVFAFPVFGDGLGTFSWTLMFLVLAEVMIMVLGAGKPYRMAIKPIAVFSTAFLSLGLQPALVVAGTDLLINLTHKIRFSRKRKKSRGRITW